MASNEELLDDDGENRALRCFLGMYQSGGNPSVKSMKIHLEHSGFNGFWPEWVNDPKNAGHLTKGGAQHWIRHLLSLENPSTTASNQEALSDLQKAADKVVIANATGNEGIFMKAVSDLISAVRAIRGEQS